jgi:hypothetical protein
MLPKEIGTNPWPRHEEKPNMQVLAHYVPPEPPPNSQATSLPIAYLTGPSWTSLIPIEEFTGESLPPPLAPRDHLIVAHRPLSAAIAILLAAPQPATTVGLAAAAKPFSF